MKFQILALLFIWGALLAAAYSVALWWTVRRLPFVPHPVLWTVGSYYLRLAGIGVGFYVAGSGSPGRLGASVAGFLLTRLFILRRMKPPTGMEKLARSQ